MRFFFLSSFLCLKLQTRLNSLFQEKVKSGIIRQQVRRGKKLKMKKKNEKKKEEIKKVVYVLSRYVCIHQILFF